jgi:hypothetical protein
MRIDSALTYYRTQLFCGEDEDAAVCTGHNPTGGDYYVTKYAVQSFAEQPGCGNIYVAVAKGKMMNVDLLAF